MRKSSHGYPSFRRVLQHCLVLLVAVGLLGGNFLRLEPALGAAPGEFAAALTAENDPVARTLLLRSHLCNPSGGNPRDGSLSHRHCDSCTVAAAALPPVQFSSAILPTVRPQAVIPRAISTPARSEIHDWLNSRAPPRTI